jgi:O-antigen ligase
VTTAILVVGIGLVLVLALVAVRPAWRLPALAFGLLAIPGNVDNLMPQMTLDPHALADGMAPAISVIDLLLAWAVVLTVRERRAPVWPAQRLLLLAGALFLLASLSALAALFGGVEPAAVLRGVILFARVCALIYLAGALSDVASGGWRLAVAVAAGGIALLANGIYTTVTEDLDRFTAATFGRNGFAVVLMLTTIVAGSLAFRWWGREVGRLGRLPAIGAVLLAAACLFAAAATGTRMALIMLVAAGALGIVFYPGALTRASAGRIAVVAVAIVGVVLSAVTFASAGARTLSILTDPGATIKAVTNAVTNADELPEYSEVRSRSEFWNQAIAMAIAHPVTGVGPYQWNVQRYQIDPDGPVVVADAHDSYLQMAAEYGLPTLVLYLLLLAGALLTALRAIVHRAARERLGWVGLGLVVAGFVYPIAEVTNSHFFNVRNGAFGWLLIAVGVTLAARRVAEAPVVEPVAPLGRDAERPSAPVRDDLHAGA